MKTIEIEWRHLRINGMTCDRCHDTGGMLRALVAELNLTCAARDVQITLIEPVLGPDQIAQSNQVLIDGLPLEDRIPAIQVGSSACSSCSDLTGGDERCRTVEIDNASYDVPPAFLIRAEVCRLGGCC